MRDSFSQTQPNRSGATRPAETGKSGPESSSSPMRAQNRQLSRQPHLPRGATFIACGLSILLLFSLAIYIGGVNGYRSAMQSRQAQQNFEQIKAIVEQYQFGLQDQRAGRYEIAKQRFEWVLDQNPNFPDVNQRLAEVNAILYATATPTPTPPPTPTPTLSPTPDLRPIQDLFATAQSFLAEEDWDGVINAVINLRSADPAYKVAQVDRMLYIALRNRGVNKILQDGDLGGGSYDLALTEQFGPLDAEASYVLGWARLYQYGSAFWGADPAAAVYYFGQVASAAPYLRDGTGWTATARYRAVLIQYGDKLASQDEWCAAEEQYRLALNISSNPDLQSAVEHAAIQCSPPTATPTHTPAFTLTPTVTSTGTLPPTWTPSPTTAAPPTGTPTPTPTETVVTQPTPPTEAPPLATETPTAELPVLTPTDTLTPTEPSTSTEPPTFTPSSTPTLTDTLPAPADSQPTAALTPKPTKKKP